MDNGLTQGERWIVETLNTVGTRRGWQTVDVSPIVELGAYTSAGYRVTLTDRYGRVYRYVLTIRLDDERK